jgi:hypothetical protein
MHSGDVGEAYFNAPNFMNPDTQSYALDYYSAGYRVVQIAWLKNNGWVHNTQQLPDNSLKYAACRVATVMQSVDAQYGAPMCAHGHSAGSAAIAYALAWYGAGSYLKSVMLTSGPVLSDIEAGCEYPNVAGAVTVCSNPLTCVGTPNGTSWTDPPQYLNSDTPNTAQAVANWTEYWAASPYHTDNCNNWEDPTGMGTPTTSTSNMNWADMSITSPGAVVSYPTTTINAFLCSNTNAAQNNSAAQGQIFFNSITSNYAIYRVDGCDGYEGVWGPNTQVTKTFGTQGFPFSASTMINSCGNTSAQKTLRDRDAELN